jgi:DNA-binding PadR family transcriptional regulator
MEEEGLLTAEGLNGKKVFSLTARGRDAREALDVDGADRAPDPWRETGEGHGALRALPAEIAGQARQLRRFGSPEQVERAAALLEDVKRELYGILANGPIRDEHAEGTGT